jgi:cell fate (sporulation/competence/biofilm development) regulator YmcA (YheA/YmcA/DUF963 family)
MDPLEKETAVAQELAELQQLLAQHPVVQEFHTIQQRAQNNPKLQTLEEAIKQTQKEIVQYEHYDKPEAKKDALRRVAELTQEYDQHPLVVAYREVLQEADELLHYVTTEIQKQVNKAIEEEEAHASEN